jgi:hypothetical protein
MPSHSREGGNHRATGRPWCRPCKNASYDVGAALGFLAVTVEAPVDIGLRLERADQVVIAAISGPTPKILIIRLRL